MVDPVPGSSVEFINTQNKYETSNMSQSINLGQNGVYLNEENRDNLKISPGGDLDIGLTIQQSVEA